MPAESYAQLRALAATDADLRKYITYEWHCDGCNHTTWLGAPGGTLHHDPECVATGEQQHIHGILAGQRISCGTKASVCDPARNP